MNSLAIFDIDGTLTDTNAVDDECYRAALADTIGVARSAIDWTGVGQFTDRAIFNHVHAAIAKRPASDADVSRARARLTELLMTAANDSPDQFTPIPGAPTVFRHLSSLGWAISVATGCWLPSARVKLTAAAINIDDALIACADDAASRVDIVTLSRRRATAFYGREFERVVSIGDGLWDVETAIELGLPFVGVGHGERAERLRNSGAHVVIENYTDLAAFNDALATARVPG